MVSEQTSIGLKHPAANPELEKITQKKKKPSQSCFLHQRVVSVIFLLGPRKLSFNCVSHYPKKKETHARPITHQPPIPIKSTPTATEPNNHQPPQSPTPHLTHQPPKPNTSPSTTAAEDVDHRRCQSLRRAAATPPCLVPPLSPPRLHTTTRRRSPTPAKDPHRRDSLYFQFNFY